jgi:gamma-glutamylcyclotransferase (GGCT)/AIG2-like uncharacterized protein YtfP
LVGAKISALGSETTAVFLYGTLMPGQVRWPVLESHVLAYEPATAKGRLWDTGFGYPAAQFDPDGDDIPGVVAAIAPEHLPEVIATLDPIEGEGVLFRRTEVATSGGWAITYEWMGETAGLRPLRTGWIARETQRAATRD